MGEEELRRHEEISSFRTESDASQAVAAGEDEPESSSVDESAQGVLLDGTHEDDPLGALPPGWVKGVTKSGRVFFIDHNTERTTWDDPRLAAGRSTLGTNQPRVHRTVGDRNTELGPMPEGWEERQNAKGRTFYVNHIARTTQWEDPRTGIASPKTPSNAPAYSRDYKRKLEQFRKKLTPLSGQCEIHVSRDQLFEEAFHRIMELSASDLRKSLYIVFEGERGYDYGGLTREFFYLLSHEMFNPYYGLFEYSAIDAYTLQVNPKSDINPEHLRYFEFIGRVVGMAIFHQRFLDAFFIRPFYKVLLGRGIQLADLESVDAEYYNSLQWILENDPAPLDLTFSVDQDQFGVVTTIDLKPGGRDIAVTNENKHEYVESVIDWRFVRATRDQMQSFMKGLSTMIPVGELKVFDENELELLIGGISEIDVDDWQAHTLYKDGYTSGSTVVDFFWKAVRSFNLEQRARLLQFVTGTSRVPIGGFVQLYGSSGPQKFTISKRGVPPELPRAHTCFNRIDLPPYTSYEETRAKILQACELSTGFAGVD